MKIVMIKKDGSKVELKSEIFSIIETSSFISIEYDQMDGSGKPLTNFAIKKEDIQLILFGLL